MAEIKIPVLACIAVVVQMSTDLPAFITGQIVVSHVRFLGGIAPRRQFAREAVYLIKDLKSLVRVQCVLRIATSASSDNILKPL